VKKLFSGGKYIFLSGKKNLDFTELYPYLFTYYTQGAVDG